MMRHRTIHLTFLLVSLTFGGALAPCRAAPEPAGAAAHWAFLTPQPQPPPKVRDLAWPQTSIDHFILTKLESAGLAPAPRADRRTLLRRATFDLHGLPPTAEEVATFERDDSPKAFARVVDRLLASPRYGERWGRYWLDVARYADTKGYVYSDREDPRYVHSHAYRDWVIRALNEDLPYDQFLKLQIAADQMQGDPADLAAMGFLTLGRRFLGVTHDIIDDRIDVLTRGTLGLTVACARCHDHKYDPIPIQDYYSLYGVFDSTTEKLAPLAIETNRTMSQVAFEKELVKRIEALETAYQKARDEVAERIRRRTTDYLVAQLTANQLPNEEFYEILDAEQVNPIFVRRWQGYLRETAKSFDPIFAPWHLFAELPEAEFAVRASEAWASLKAESGAALNPLVVEAFDRDPPTSMKAVAQRYGELFEQAIHSAAGDTTSGASGEPAVATEALRAVLHATEGPVYPPMGSPNDTAFYFDEGTRVNLGKLWKAIEEWHLTAEGAMPYAGILEDRDPRAPRVFKRGNPGDRGEEVPRQFLRVLAGPDRKPFAQGSGRLEMAELIVTRENPLTARVMVNRVWLHHFGAGLVKSASDFGARCDTPSHPELLDHLAVWLMDRGWSLKELHRLMMLSSVYQQQSAPEQDDKLQAPSQEASRADPENRLLWKANRRRLDFEALRDSLLAASGELDLTAGGRAVSLFSKPWATRRAVYGYIDRQFLPGALRTFDFANPDLHTPQRHETTVPQQALYLMNNAFVIERARALAERTGALPPAERVMAMFASAFQRAPTAAEMDQALGFIRASEADPPEAVEPRPPSAWQYGYGQFDTAKGQVQSFTAFPHFTPDAWQGGPAWPDPTLGWLRLTAEGGHPGEPLAVVRRWIAPLDGVVKVSGTLAHDSAPGDGVRGTVVHSAAGALGSWSVHQDTADTVVAAIEVTRGQWLDFVVDRRETLSNDDFKWAPVVALTVDAQAGNDPGEPAEWNAQKDFAGPLPEPIEPLEAWPALAQVLMLSNEFAFVD